MANRFWSLGPRNRVFLFGGVGTSFDDDPLPTDQFALGTPFRLGAYSAGELRGAHYYLATAGYLRQVGRLPDFMGGPVFTGGWLENGDAFDDWSRPAGGRTAASASCMDTLVGPVIVAGSWGFDGRWRTVLGRRPALPLKRRLIDSTDSLEQFFRTEAAGGALLVGCACAALIVANSGWAEPTNGFWRPRSP